MPDQSRNGPARRLSDPSEDARRRFAHSGRHRGARFHEVPVRIGHAFDGVHGLAHSRLQGGLVVPDRPHVSGADRALRSCGFEAGRLERTVLSAGLAAASLNFLHVWAPTPSYNWLALQGLMIACTGLLLADPDRQARPPAVAGVLIALGGWTCFMAKPSSAAGLAVCALLYLVVARKPVWRVLLLAGALASLLLLGSAWVIDGSLAPFVARYRIGMRMAEIMMGASNEVSILPRLRGLKLEPLTFWQFLSGVPALAAIAWMAGARSRAAGALSTLALCALALVTLLVVLGVLPGLLGQAYYRGLLLGALPLAMLAVAVLRGREGAEQDRIARGIEAGVRIALEAIADDGVHRRVDGLAVIDYPMPRGSVAGYFPELNALLPLAHHDRTSGTPAAKSIPVRVVAA